MRDVLFMSFRKLVKPEDLNPANRLFGGRIMEWADEAAALYAMCQMETKSIVTLKVSEILFKNPALSGDVLEFKCRRGKVGTTSLTVQLSVYRKDVATKQAVTTPNDLVLQCEFVFVKIDENGKPTPHGITNDE